MIHKLSFNSPLTTNGNTLAGYAALYNSPVVRHDSRGKVYHLQFKPGAFDQTLANDRITVVIGHADSKVIGVSGAKNTRLKLDSKGIYFEVDLPATTLANDLKAEMEMGLYAGCSIAVEVLADEWVNGDKPLQTALNTRLYHIGPVIDPADANTTLDLLSKFPAPIRRSNKEKLIKILRSL